MTKGTRPKGKGKAVKEPNTVLKKKKNAIHHQKENMENGQRTFFSKGVEKGKIWAKGDPFLYSNTRERGKR